MRLHPRYHPMRKAACEVGAAVLKAVEDHDLTYGELISILAQETAMAAKYLVRIERHPDDPEKKGDEA